MSTKKRKECKCNDCRQRRERGEWEAFEHEEGRTYRIWHPAFGYGENSQWYETYEEAEQEAEFMNELDSCVTDPPYELGFMGKDWDQSGVANSVELWKEVRRPPGSE